MLVHAESALGLVEDGLGGGAVNLAVLGAAHLVADLLSSGLLAIGLDTTAIGIS